MPIVIDEVVITVEVQAPATPAGAGAAAGSAPAGAAQAAAADRQAIVAECVERVLDILAARQEP